MDLVSRKAVMDSLTEEYNRRREDGLKLAWIELAVNRVGSAWISVKDRLPKHLEQVLIWVTYTNEDGDEEDGYTVQTTYFDGEPFLFGGQPVEWWMPALPGPEKERIATAPAAPRNDKEAAEA